MSPEAHDLIVGVGGLCVAISVIINSHTLIRQQNQIKALRELLDAYIRLKEGLPTDQP
jgi:hypothetical protein